MLLRRSTSSCAALVAFWLMLGLPAQAAETITIVADKWCPYNCDPDSPQPGFLIEIAKKAFARHDIEVQYMVMPWSRAIDSVRTNKFTAAVGAIKSDAPDFIFPEIEQGMSCDSIYVLKEKPWRYNGIASLAQVSLGAAADYAYSEPINSYIKQHKNEMIYVQLIGGEDPLVLNLKKLQAGRIGAVLEDKHVMDYYLSNHPQEKPVVLAHTAPLAELTAVYIAFSPQNNFSRRYAGILAQETDAMRKSGELKAILDKYHVEDWK